MQAAARGSRRTLARIAAEALSGLAGEVTVKRVLDGVEREVKVPAVPVEKLAAALASGDADKVLAVLNWQAMEEKLAEIVPELEDAFKRAASSAHELLPSGLPKLVKLEPVLDRAAVWAKQKGSELVTAITNETREAIRETVARAFDSGRTRDMSARELRSFVGLNRVQASSLDKYAESLSGEKPVRRQALIERRQKKMLQARGNAISRTESQNAGCAGQRELWLEAKPELEDDFEREWVTLQRPNRQPCFCPELDGMRAPIDQPYPDERAGNGPTAHTHCECQERIVRKKTAKLLTYRGRVPGDPHPWDFPVWNGDPWAEDGDIFREIKERRVA